MARTERHWWYGAKHKEHSITKYLLSFPSDTMAVPQEELQAVANAARAVIAEATAAGDYVFAGGINELQAPVKVGVGGRHGG